ncbi:17469_t:CDS:2 [Dentiscutata erythropus]|uniref:17469_t:CDS:1 n=1 Tax=Dentiscutata erythropus TaxID=1348616 RepID=A0A9N9BBR9_9GLOM|nr:17469_t:CDS:2 [Dentiscutata erythropus]
MIASKILTKVDSCIVGSCNDNRKLNICRNKREYGLSIDTEYQFGPQNKIIEDSEDTKQNTYFQLTTYHNQDRERRIQLPIEKDVTIQTDPSIRDIILDRDIQDIQFHKYIMPHLETKLKVECGGCEFQDHEINLCLNLNKLKVCLLENDQNTVKIFNQGNFALVGFVDYCNMFYKFKQENGDKNFLFFGENFSSIEARLDIPFFLHGGYVETS